MKRIVIGILALATLPVFGCKKLKSLANINIDIPYSTQVTMPVVYEEGVPIPFGGYKATIGPIGITTNSRQYMAEYNTDADNIVSVQLSKLMLKILSPSTESIDFLDTVRVYISAQGQPEVLAAYSLGRVGGDSLALTCSQQSLKPYFLADVMNIKLVGHFNRVPAPGTTVEINSVFYMVANPLY